EVKDVFLKFDPTKDNYKIKYDNGVNVGKLDKGCIVFNQRAEDGFTVCIIDSNKSNDTQYWKNDFLNIQPIKNEYHQTNQFLGIAKHFVTKQLSEVFEVSKTDQIDFLNRSVDYFKNNETFKKQDFENEVFGDDSIVESFRDFSKNYEDKNEIKIEDSFPISPQAVKKQARVFKSVLK